MINLISNAIKFTDHGFVKVTVSGETNNQRCMLSVFVEDTGIGIAADKLDAIFHSFEQADASTTRPYDGAGLGLAISKQLANAMGGDISVCSTIGQGSTFTFNLEAPIAANEDASARQTAPMAANAIEGQTEEIRQTPVRVLIVDDNEINRLVLKSMIGSDGYDITLAVDGLEALNAYKSSDYDIVLMDISMPKMDGYQAAEAIRRFEHKAEAKRTPIICVTAHAFETHQQQSQEAGMDDYLAKPVDQAQISAVLSRWGPAGNATHDAARAG